MQSAIYGGIPTANPTFLWLRRFGRQWIPGREVVVVSHFFTIAALAWLLLP